MSAYLGIMVLFKSWNALIETYPHLVYSLFIWNQWLATVLVSMRFLVPTMYKKGGLALVGNKPAPAVYAANCVSSGSTVLHLGPAGVMRREGWRREAKE